MENYEINKDIFFPYSMEHFWRYQRETVTSKTMQIENNAQTKRGRAHSTH